MKTNSLNAKSIFMVIVGSLLFVCAVNWFITPLSLYSGGIVGLSQLLRTLLFSGWKYDAAGIINLCLNIPLFLLAYHSMNRRILIGTVIALLIQTVSFTLIPIPSSPILNDTLANIFIGGIMGGIGCGIVLTAGATAGGLDLLGIYLAQKNKDFSVGRVGMIFNAALYAVCAVLFNLSTAIYSVIYIAVFSFVLDKYHYQNIEVQMMIFTHHPEVKEDIMHSFVRGVTCWKGVGAYTGKETEVLVTVVAKSEAASIKKDILKLDPDAFIIVNEGTNVTGGYQKRLI